MNNSVTRSSSWSCRFKIYKWCIAKVALVIGPQTRYNLLPLLLFLQYHLFFQHLFFLRSPPCCDVGFVVLYHLSRYVIALVHHRCIFYGNCTLSFFFFSFSTRRSFWICVMRQLPRVRCSERENIIRNHAHVYFRLLKFISLRVQDLIHKKPFKPQYVFVTVI